MTKAYITPAIRATDSEGKSKSPWFYPGAFAVVFSLMNKKRHKPRYKILSSDVGASGGSRNLILSLENLHTNRCTTLACALHYSTFFAYTVKNRL